MRNGKSSGRVSGFPDCCLNFRVRTESTAALSRWGESDLTTRTLATLWDELTLTLALIHLLGRIDFSANSSATSSVSMNSLTLIGLVR